MPSDRHQKLLYEKMRKLEAQGHRIVAIDGQTRPDAIAIIDGQIVAIEVLGRQKRKTEPRKGKGKSRGYKYDGGLSLARKRQRYARFDDIVFILFDYGVENSEREILASEEWPEEMKYNREWWQEFEHAKRMKYASGDKDA